MIQLKNMKYTLITLFALWSLNTVAQKPSQSLKGPLIYSSKTYKNSKVVLPVHLKKEIKPIQEIEDPYLQSVLEKEINSNETWKRCLITLPDECF